MRRIKGLFDDVDLDVVFFLEIIEQMDVVRNQEYRRTCFMHFHQNVSDLLRVFSIKISRRFISDDKFRIMDQRPCKSNSLFFS